MCLCTVLDANGQGILYRDQWLLACWWCSCTYQHKQFELKVAAMQRLCSLPIACCRLPTAHCLLPFAYYLLPIACCLWLNRFGLLLLWLLYECFVSGWKLITGEARNYVLAWVWQHSGQWTHFLGDSFKQAVFVPLGNIHMWAPGGYLQDSCSVLLHAQKWKRHTEWEVVLNEKENLPVKRT